jgi:lysophospholipase L1-like esterase
MCWISINEPDLPSNLENYSGLQASNKIGEEATMNAKRLALPCVTAFLVFFMVGIHSYAEDGQLLPCRLASIGDSITEAIDAEAYGANHWASWANGYYGFWQWLFGLSNVNSHNQRISATFRRDCRFRRKNFMEAESGADSFDLFQQAQAAVAHGATYVPWLMGHNDICQDYESEIPTEAEFEDNVRAALEELKNLPDGATIYVVGMVDVPSLYEVAEDKKALGIVDCEVLWFFTFFELFPCGTILGPLRTDIDRDAMRQRIMGGDGFEGFNPILQRLVSEFSSVDKDHNYYYTNDVFDFSNSPAFTEDHVSDLDCFHPSALGQFVLSFITWDTTEGPRFQDW